MSDSRKIYGWEDSGVFFLSPFEAARGTYRPINRYDTREEAQAEADRRNCVVVWEN